jgi:hypothetical protein
MADKKDNQNKSTSELAQVAESLRRGNVRRREDDRTTLEMTDPTEQGPDELGELLVTRGLITRHQLFNALNESYRTGATLEQAIAALGLVDRETLASIALELRK